MGPHELRGSPETQSSIKGQISPLSALLHLGREVSSANFATLPLTRGTEMDVGVQTCLQVSKRSRPPCDLCKTLAQILHAPRIAASPRFQSPPPRTPPRARNLDWPKEADPPLSPRPLRLGTRPLPLCSASEAYPW